MSHNMFVGSGKRSGTRGGADQFSWDKVKADKYKDFYLGHSLHTTAKPTFNNRKPNPLWWTKAQGSEATQVDDEARRRAEIEAIKREEEQLHLEALGLAPRRRKAQENQLDSNDIQELTRRGNTERDAYDAERVAGLGYAPAPQHLTEGALLPKAKTSQEQHGLEGGDDEGAAGEWAEAKDAPDRKDKKDKEERREEKRKRKEEKRKRKEAAGLDKQDEKMKKSEKKQRKKQRRERSERDRHSDKASSDRKGARDRDGDRADDGEGDYAHRRRHREDRDGQEPRSRRRRDSSSRSPKRRRRHDSPSPPSSSSSSHRRHRHRSPQGHRTTRHDSPS